ncbi:MAG: hypothetical protein ACN4GM_03530 [Gammaproteobacteria bacterium]
MPYYVYKIENAEMSLLKQLDFVQEFESFKEAKKFAKSLRVEQVETDTATIKVIFADNKLHAEEMLMEKREQPIVMEHEK